ncbi:prolyl 4-hydroxylase subunit alpha-1-like isoform X1 [Daphnia pulicaria]|uniref:prolyl 4-hydroxylase subunit alpha-1-like isoform X1 n=1 Tax=Daphnia pulicaria TaxID=35523 RepID=UPI001EEB0161|nr:prolyl 4-hydroxylase subunit alpha-1-like isoform X1 [Daphnia pulicaria]XP_046656305.1 prolyl 4-hydroxylase subunit alpha-1-like isoform X1 [Daphnia pulicaria]XP_046656306.1 prolyl 4-hydroxylase subunit alpha-1-like isoform X1 [Daphnia pulicaria]
MMGVILSMSAILLVMQTNAVLGEVFTALSEMEGLVTTELELVRHLDNYIQEEEIRLKQLKRFLEEYESMYQEASEDVSQYLSNPVNAYLLVKRLTSDWKQVEEVMTQNVGSIFVKNITRYRSALRFPSDEDLTGAAVALMRLQDTYELDTHALAEGKLLGKKYSRQLTAGDCWELGRQSYNNGDHYHTVLWMGEALNKLEEESNKTATRQEILEYLAFSTYKQGNVKEALQLTDELLKIVPFHQRGLSNIQYYREILHQQGEIQFQQQHETAGANSTIEPFNTSKLKLTKPSGTAGIPAEQWNKYERLCRGEKLMDPKIEARLRCRYVTNNVPYFFIQPIKMELASLKPRLVIYHNVVTDKEIETAKKLAQSRLRRSTVQNSLTGASEPTKYRIAKAAFLQNSEHDHIVKMTRRIGDVTGLDMATAEELQVCNYGIGGHYEPHYDHARKGEVQKDFGWGNRIATWMFYMSDVEAGGATVFPQINLSLWPQKGSAAFWFNLHPNGEGDDLTQHAACPVLTGSKWVSNKWIHERNQEFRRPCGLTFDAEM